MSTGAPDGAATDPARPPWTISPREAMRRRIRTLAVVEALNVGLLAAVFFWVLGIPASPANVVGYGVVALLLVEGAGYWWVKARQLASGAPLPAGMSAFRPARTGNVVLLAMALPVIAAGMWHEAGWRSWPGLAFWLFAVAEHVNYFHVQLSHQTRADLRRLRRHRRLRASHLARDLTRAPHHNLT